ncbi:hypothetical protein BU23DRAFT_59413 [Bimuria novae-zelandiae CBS 107.79]|uniref:MHYT domain-containing protein n=1 Tax=Bimuria novae-zelandiae CBS 107.79 TaxID=1447943 RepID=A0A6A5VH47_9PLEO|nr:hypothetical protein BU23DRAFT_59413 [Bimuria novae-zelandiae CBS 107.79]
MGPIIEELYPIGSRPGIHYLPHLIFISYIVSLIGAFTTVELLHRRVSGSGWRSLVQLGACAVSFGLVAIWCMHFVGNRAIIVGRGESEIQLYYNATYTTVSAILPIVVIFMGLLAADRFYKNNKNASTRYAALLICGVCCGASVTAMHYLGNQGTTNYQIRNTPAFVIGAAAIAIVACFVAFSLFFHWSGHWMNVIWRRIIVAFFLAVAVCGMHWTAAAGTSYEIRGYHRGSGAARNINVIVAVCLCLGACGVCFTMGFIKQRQQRKERDRAKQVVLAVATFDSDGRLLVTPGGLLPCQTITRQFHQRTFDEEFNIRHPVFQWLYRVSRNWSGIVDLIPAMRDHLQHMGYVQVSTPLGNPSRDSLDTEEGDSTYSAIFRQMFCVTAQDIARSMETRLQDLGYLFEDVLTTGTLLTKIMFRDGQGKTIIANDVGLPRKDVEAGPEQPILFGRGQLLVLTRKVGKEESNRLQNIGYRFASTDQIGDQLARSMQISRHDLNDLIARLQTYCDRKAAMPRYGTYLASFLLQPSPVMKGLDVIVSKACPDRLPMVKFMSDEPTPKQLRMLSAFNGFTLDECLIRLSSASGLVTADDVFMEKFRNCIQELVGEVPEPALRQATFSSQQLDIAHGISGQNEALQATVFAFCGIKEVYNQSLSSQKLRYVPLSFFKASLRSYPGCPDHAILAHENHKEFGSLFAPTGDFSSHGNGPKSSPKWASIFRSNGKTMSESIVQADSSSEQGLVPNPQTSLDPPNSMTNPFGGIMVSQEVIISQVADVSQIELHEMGVRSQVSAGDSEQMTVADRLLSITTSFRDPHARLLTKEHPARR